ncbi:MAG: hypothetical protein LPK45_00705, partial [Bacteroidota bacterium]|nr:hypothetical protein [Bacteroidota bacterium]MDX5429544.1 hypothetical protein [Bacteroidota bacterium]MDX5468331.1 hypothetical protein [Bacteroidota bacterium]
PFDSAGLAQDDKLEEEFFDSASLAQDDKVEKENLESRVKSQETETSVVSADSQEPIADSFEDPEPEKTDFLHWLGRLNEENLESEGESLESRVKSQETETSVVSADSQDPIANSSEDPEPDTQNLTPETRNLTPEPEQPEAKSQEPSADDLLITRFIETNPSISRVQEKFFDPVVKAKESERLDDTLITETMAKILVKQEKFDKAIDAYRKLQLKYPKKSDYFAALIEELKLKIN